MKKIPFVTKNQIEEIVKTYPTPFHIYDEKGIRENARLLKKAFEWNKGFKEYFAVKATPNPYILQSLGVSIISLLRVKSPPGLYLQHIVS